MLTPFLQYVSEARLVRRQSDLQRYTFQEIAERIYLSFLTLSLLKNFKQTAGFVKSYGTNTLAYGKFDRVRTTANDLSAGPLASTVDISLFWSPSLCSLFGIPKSGEVKINIDISSSLISTPSSPNAKFIRLS